MDVTHLAGAWPVLITPYDGNLQVDYSAYRDLLEWYITKGVGGLYANCLSSEMYLLDDDERVQIVADAVKTAGGRVPVAATGNLGASLADIALAARWLMRATSDAGRQNFTTTTLTSAPLRSTVAERSMPAGTVRVSVPQYHP